MRDMNAVHDDLHCDGVREKSYKTCLSQRFYLTDLTAHKGELRLRKSAAALAALTWLALAGAAHAQSWVTMY
jgi:hypothetical protein